LMKLHFGRKVFLTNFVQVCMIKIRLKYANKN
jgi:hypothetical protein